MPPIKHAKRSPSSLKKFQVSPCFLPSGKTNEAATRGSICHEAVETGNDSQLSEREESWVDEVRAYVEPYRAEATQVFEEIKLEVVDGGKQLIYGTADLLILSADGTLHLMDWKFGAWAVDPAPENLQLRAYALGAFQAHPEVNKIKVHILQPPRDEVTTHTYNRAEDYENMLNEIRAILDDARSFEEHKIYAPAKDTCLFCGRLDVCPVSKTKFLGVTRRYDPARFEKLPLEIHPDRIDPKNAPQLLEVAGLAGAWASAIRAAVTDQVLADGAPVPEGYQLVTQADSKFSETAVASLRTWAEAEGISENELFKALKPHRQSLIDLARSTAPRGHKGAVETEFINFLRENEILTDGTTRIYLKKAK